MAIPLRQYRKNSELISTKRSTKSIDRDKQGDAPLICTLEEALDLGAEAVGMKAFNLAKLESYGVTVPISLVVTAYDTDRLLTRLAINSSRRAMDVPPVGNEHYTILQQAIISSAADDEERRALNEALIKTGLSGKRLAVRSSAIAEDGRDHSFAGIHRSELNISGEDALWQAIRRCQASFWDPRALAYRERASISKHNIRGAIVLCEMVASPTGEPAAAGVLFTCDPISGAPDTSVIEMVPGLADKLVDGQVTPGRATISLRTGILQADRVASDLLDTERFDTLMRTGLRIRAALSNGEDLRHFDIEWAFDGKRLFIVQARPVTAMIPSHVSSVDQIWTQANLNEVLPSILTPFSWSVIGPGLRWALLDPIMAAGVAFPPALAMLKRINGRPFVDLSAMQWVYYTGFGVPPSQINESFGGVEDEIDLAAIPSRFVDTLMRQLRALLLARKLSQLRRQLDPGFADVRKISRRAETASLPTIAREDLLALWRDAVKITLQVPFGLAVGAALPWLTMVRGLWPRNDDGPPALAVIGGLLAGSADLASAEHGYALAHIAQIQSPTERADALATFLQKFGHRGFDEFELSKPRWREDQETVRLLVAQLANTPDPAERQAKRQAEARARLKRLPWWTRHALKALVPRIAAGFSLREEARSESIRLLGILRMITCEVGRRLAQSDMIAHADDVFFLDVADILGYLEGDWTGKGARSLITENRQRLQAWRGRAPEALTVRSGESVKRRPNVRLPKGSRLIGIAASPGRVTGRARIINAPEEFGRLRAGDILVCRVTDPAWTPLFLAAQALVVENGGYLSHGAIVAREFGIPAVVNLPGVMQNIADGSEITVDGDQGIVVLSH